MGIARVADAGIDFGCSERDSRIMIECTRGLDKATRIDKELS